MFFDRSLALQLALIANLSEINNFPRPQFNCIHDDRPSPGLCACECKHGCVDLCEGPKVLTNPQMGRGLGAASPRAQHLAVSHIPFHKVSVQTSTHQWPLLSAIQHQQPTCLRAIFATVCPSHEASWDTGIITYITNYCVNQQQNRCRWC